MPAVMGYAELPFSKYDIFEPPAGAFAIIDMNLNYSANLAIVRKIAVYNCYEIKGILKEAGFSWNSWENVWDAEMTQEKIDFLKSINVTILKK